MCKEFDSKGLCKLCGLSKIPSFHKGGIVPSNNSIIKSGCLGGIVRGKKPTLIIVDDITPIPKIAFHKTLMPKKELIEQRKKLGEIKFEREYLENPINYVDK